MRGTVVVIVGMLYFIGCKGDNGADGATGLRGAGGPDKVGSIGGYVFLKDTANTFLPDRRGVIASL
ncbi:MAG: hypothetical protein PHP42_13085 [Bacteroidota bacterium]|nr:hypothetical protein [Bacteroidota bacterium]